MKRFLRLSILGAMVLMSTLPAFNALHAGQPPVKTDIKLTEFQREMQESNNDFACNLFRTIHEQKQDDGSTIVSPISVSFLLGMLEQGAEGETYQQIADVLGLGGSIEEISKYFKKMMEGAPRVDSRVTVKIANSINVNSALGIRLIPEYQADMIKYYHAQVDELDFKKESSLHHINNWCNTHTGGKIPKILDELTTDAAMYLLNAVYFKASWTKKFDPKLTRELDFTKQDGSTVKRQMMHLKTRAAYGEDDLCKMLSLPYGSGGYSMYVLLPHDGKTIGDIIQNLTAQKLKQVKMRTSTSHEVDILLPRFTTAGETNLKGVLSSMGMPLAFDKNLAEFPYMSQVPEGLYVSMMKQVARIEVNEDGTVATAVTVAETTNRSMHISNVYTFYATHPFVYYIVENSTGTIFFMGAYCGD